MADKKTATAASIQAMAKEAVEKQYGKSAPPRDRRLPLSLVKFKSPVEVPGAPHAVQTLEAGKPTVGCPEFISPRLFLDPELQAVVVEGRHFPLSDVRYYERAKAA